MVDVNEAEAVPGGCSPRSCPGAFGIPLALLPRPDGSRPRLWSIAGEWATDGHVVGDPPVLVKGTDTYEVLAGGYFLVHDVDVTSVTRRFEPSK
jgi:hypothetical protein